MRRAAVDTSVWVSAALNPAGYPARLLARLRAGRFVFVASEPMLAELEKVLARPYFARYGITREDARSFALRIRRRAALVAVTGELALCRDPTDDMVIETALRGGAEVLVSRDEDLTRDLALTEALAEAGVRVLTVRRFLAELEQDRPD